MCVFQDDLPGRTLTILRTAGKLQPFPFNAFPALPHGHRARLQPVQGTGAAAGPADGLNLCALCRAPLSSAEMEDLGAGRTGAGASLSESGQRSGADAGVCRDEGPDKREQARAKQAEERGGAAVPARELLRRDGAGAGSTSGESDGRDLEVVAARHADSNGDSRGSIAEQGAAQPGPQSDERPGGTVCCRSCREQVLAGTKGLTDPAWLHDLPWLDRARGRAAEEARREQTR